MKQQSRTATQQSTRGAPGKGRGLCADHVSFLTLPCRCRAAVHFEKGDYEAAIKDCDTAVEKGRELRADYALIARALARKGTALVKLGRLEEAVGVFNKSLTEHRTADTLKKLNEAEKTLKVGFIVWVVTIAVLGRSGVCPAAAGFHCLFSFLSVVEAPSNM